MHRRRSVFCAALAALACLATADAQEFSGIGDQLSKEDVSSRLNFDVPSSVGFAILGVSPENVVTPRKGSEFALGLLNGLDANGNFQSGIAIEANPYFWTLPERVQLDAYLNDRTYRLLSGLSFSLATSSGQESADEADRVGFGLNYVYDFDDPLYSEELSDCVFTVQDDILDAYRDRSASIQRARTLDEGNEDLASTAETARGGLVDELSAEGEKRVDGCYAEHSSWNRTIFQLGIAAHKSELEAPVPIDENGYSAWLSYAWGFGEHYQLVVHGSLLADALVPQDDVLVVTDKTFVGGRLRIGSERLRGFIETGYTDEDRAAESDSYWQGLAGAEIHLRDGLFFQFSYGDTFGGSGDKDEHFSGQLKWALSPGSLF